MTTIRLVAALLFGAFALGATGCVVHTHPRHHHVHAHKKHVHHHGCGHHVKGVVVVR